MGTSANEEVADGSNQSTVSGKKLRGCNKRSALVGRITGRAFDVGAEELEELASTDEEDSPLAFAVGGSMTLISIDSSELKDSTSQ